MEENKIEFINESKMELAENLNKSENIKENIGNSSNHDSIFLQIIKAVAFSGIISIALLGILMKAHARANDHFSWLKSTFSSVANENEALYGVARNNFMFKLYIVFIILIFVFLCWFYFKKMENKVLKALKAHLNSEEVMVLGLALFL